MIDLHSHILPGLDDGSRNVAESLQMLEASARQGVKWMAATPHFYATEQTPSQFLRRRSASVDALRSRLKSGFPKIVLGAEVRYFEGMSRTEELDSLRLEGSPVLLLEMPFCTWSKRMVDEVLEIQSHKETQVLLAHVERYWSAQSKQVIRTLQRSGVWMQCNASFFLSWRTKRKALRMLQKGEIHMLGSDAHNMTTRPPRLGDAMEVIEKSLGRDALRNFQRRTVELLKAGSAP